MKKLNILIPMAGEGSRFRKEGFKDPKPFIEVLGQRMIEWVINNFQIENRDCKFIFICRKEHLEQYDFNILIKNNLYAGSLDYEIIPIDYLTEGALCTALKARKFINNEDELLIANSDQWLNWDSDNFISLIEDSNCDGATITSFSNHPKWSYVKLDEQGWVIQTKEKEVISNICNTGIFYYKKGSDFVKAADELIHRNERVNNEFYIAPTFNVLINQYNQKILNYPISNHAFWGLGTPEDLKLFIEHQERLTKQELIQILDEEIESRR